MWIPSGDIRDQSVKLYEIGANFACFGGPNLFGGRPPEFLDLHYKAHPDCDYAAKFHGDRPRELGDLVAKEIKRKKKTSAVNIRPSGTTVPGGLIITTFTINHFFAVSLQVSL